MSNLVEFWYRFDGTYCPHLQDKENVFNSSRLCSNSVFRQKTRQGHYSCCNDFCASLVFIVPRSQILLLFIYHSNTKTSEHFTYKKGYLIFLCNFRLK